MKKVITIIGIFGLIFVQAQKVGINQDAPKATLDIKAETANTTEDVEGLLVPRVSKNKAFLMAGNTTTPLKESTLVYVDNTADYTTTPVAPSVADITEKGYYFWNGSKWVKTAGKDGAEWLYNSTTKQVDLKRSGLTPSINKIFYDEKGRYRSLGEDEVYVVGLGSNPVRTISKSLNGSDVIGEATVYESINSKNNVTYTHLNGTQSKLHFVRNYLVNKSDVVKNHSFARNTMSVPIENTNDYTIIYNAINGNELSGKGNIGSSISNWGFLKLGGSQKITGYATSLMGESTYLGSGNISNFLGIYARNHFYSGTGTIEKSMSGLFSSESIEASNDATLIRHNYGIENYVLSTSKNTGAGVELAGIRTLASAKGSTKYPNMYGIKSATVIGTEAGVAKPTNLYSLWISDAKGAEQNNYAIYTNAGKVRFGDETGVIRNLKSFTAGENIHGYKSELTLTGASAFKEDVNGYWANVKSDGGISTNGVFVHATQTGNNTVVSPAMPLVSGTYGDAKVEKATSAYNAIGAAGMAESAQKGSNTGLNGVARNAAKVNIGVNAIANANNTDIAREIGTKLASGFTAAVNAYNPSTGANDFAINAKGKVRVEDINTTENTSTNDADRIVVADATGVLKTKSASDLVANAAEWNYDPATKQTNLKRSGTAPFINKIFYDEKGRYRSLGEDEVYVIELGSNPVRTISKSLNGSDVIGEATVYESINSKNNLANTDLKGRQSKRHIERNYLVNKSDAVKNHFFARNAMTVPIENINDYTIIYNAIDGNELTGKGNIGTSISNWGFLKLGGSQKITGYATSLMGESVYLGSGNISNFLGIYARNHFYSGTGTIEKSISGLFSSESIEASNDATLIRHNYGIENYVLSTSKNTGAGVELAGIRTLASAKGSTKYPNMYGIKSTTVIGTEAGVAKPTNLYSLWISDAKGAEKENYSIYTNAGRVSFGDVIQLRATRTPSSSTDVLATDKEGDVIRDADFIYVLVNESGTLKWKRSALSTW